MFGGGEVVGNMRQHGPRWVKREDWDAIDEIGKSLKGDSFSSFSMVGISSPDAGEGEHLPRVAIGEGPKVSLLENLFEDPVIRTCWTTYK